MGNHKAGFVNIIGNPNVGKSTLMNTLVGEKLSIISPKAQTTRHRIMGIVNDPDFQIVYSDTPGIVTPAYKLHDGMMAFVQSAIEDADCILFVVEAKDRKIKNPQIFEGLQKTSVPVILVINKIDLLEGNEVLDEEFKYWEENFPKAQIFPISALHKANVPQVLKAILSHLPENEAFFPKDELTDKTMRFFAGEIIREKIFNHYQQEIPYACEVEIEFFKEETTPVHVMAVINVERETQKGIVIGKGGKKLKWVGHDARLDIEAFIGKKVFLEMFVKVNKDWKNQPRELRKFGYIQA
jgi:GTPase